MGTKLEINGFGTTMDMGVFENGLFPPSSLFNREHIHKSMEGIPYFQTTPYQWDI